jgi:hypothetical protein
VVRVRRPPVWDAAIVYEPAGQNDRSEEEEEQSASVDGLERRNRMLVIVGLVCFLVGLPLVSLSDGTALSVIGLCLETVAGACVVAFVYMLAGDQHDPDSEPED